MLFAGQLRFSHIRHVDSVMFLLNCSCKILPSSIYHIILIDDQVSYRHVIDYTS